MFPLRPASRGPLFVALFGVVISASACAPHRHGLRLEVPAASTPARGITIVGVGKASGKPNIARSTIGVEARSGTAEQAIAEVNSRMAQVISALKQAGVADKDIRTASISLNFERAYEPPPLPAAAPMPAAPPKGQAAPVAATPAAPPAVKLPLGFYNASNSVEVTIRNLDSAGKVLSAATAAGADQLYGIRFEIEDLTPLQAEARQKAVADAKARASRLAELAGVKLGPAVSITEFDSGGGGGPVPMMAMAKVASVPVESGELTIGTSVQIVYALAEE